MSKAQNSAAETFAADTSIRVYCAGPLFNASEQSEMTDIADSLVAAGFQVYLPHRDGMEFRLILSVLVERGWSRAQAAEFLHAAIFALDVYQLAADCDAMVWNLNGRTPDEGAVSEAAMAWTLGKPLVAFTNDARSLIEGRINPLLVGLVEFQTVPEISQIVPALQREIQRTPPPRMDCQTLPAKMVATVQAGQTLWTTMQQMGAQFDNERISDVVTELFAPQINATETPSGDRASS